MRISKVSVRTLIKSAGLAVLADADAVTGATLGVSLWLLVGAEGVFVGISLGKSFTAVASDCPLGSVEFQRGLRCRHHNWRIVFLPGQQH